VTRANIGRAYRQRMRSISCVALIAAALTAFGQARETVNVHLVEVPVSVVDAGGNPVRGLTAGNFEVLDNGTSRPISSFDTIDFASAESVNATSPLNPAARRSFLLLFDLAYSTPNSLSRSQDAARRFVKDVLQPRDTAAVATIDVDRGFHMLTAFTTDRDLTNAAIAEPIAFRGTDPLQIANTSSYTGVDVMSSGGGGGAVDPGVVGDHMKNMVELTTRSNEEYVRARIEKQIRTLQELARMLRGVSGRKQIVLLSEGFDPKLITGRDAREIGDDQQELAQAVSGAIWRVDSDARFGTSASLTLLDRMARTFRGSDVILHAIDIQGVRVQNDVAGGQRINSNRGLYALARPTGGEVFQNSNDLKQNFERLLRQQEVVYVVGFRASSDKPGEFHELRVRLLNAPKGARLTHRAGYYEGGTESREERVLTNAEIIVNDIPQTDVRMRALAAAFPQGNGRAQVPVIIEIDGNDAVKDFRGSVLSIEVFVYAFDGSGTVRDRLYQRVSLDLRKVGERLRDGGLKYYGSLALPEGTYAVKSLVRVGDVDRRGFARADVVVPRADEAAVAALVPVDEHPRAVLVRSNGSSLGEYPFQVAGQRFIPGVAPRVDGGPQKMALFVRGLSPEEIAVQASPGTTILKSLADDNGSVVLLEINPGQATAAALDVTIKRSAAGDLKAHLPIARQ
jgi:VWFA-related protein